MRSFGDNRWGALVPTAVYDRYWQFAAERQAVYFRRLAGARPHWTDDSIIQRYKFTNAYRAADRVSQFLIAEVIYGDGRSEEQEETVFRILVFKLFNKIETWKALETQLGALRWASFDEAAYNAALESFMASGHRAYSGAYIMPPVRAWETGGIKHRGHIALVAHMMRDGLPQKIRAAESLEEVFQLLKSYPSIGNFLAYQLAIDLNYSPIINFSEDDFVVPGPGALDGISKCFVNYRDFAAEEIIEMVAAHQDAEFERLGLQFRSLFGRPLQLIDCQNLFCEISKYSRVSHPEVVGTSGRTRIKQAFQAKPALPTPFFPPKWGINDAIDRSSASAR